jgi:hypothetical protein
VNERGPENLWKQYGVHIDLYKFYIEVVVKIGIFFYAITGGILSYYLSHSDAPLIRYSLALPIIFSFALACLFLWGSCLTDNSRNELIDIVRSLALSTFPEYNILKYLLRIFAACLFITGVGLIGLFLRLGVYPLK